MKSLGFLLMLSAASVSAQTEMQSEAFEQLRGIEGQAPDLAPTRESAKELSASGFITVKSLSPTSFVELHEQEPIEKATPRFEVLPPKVFLNATAPMKGLNLYGMAQDDPTGTGTTDKPTVKPPISPKLVKGSWAVGILATIGGLLFPPALFLGGFALGAALVMTLVNKKVAA